MIADKFIHFNSSSLHYAKTGNGDKPLLVFHGFGQDKSAFESLAASLSTRYTVYVFDLYFHGKNHWAHGEKTLTKEEWKKSIELFLGENKIQTFSIAGFSLGGKFVLSILEAFPEKINSLYLIAPDGIKTSFWYSLATYPIVLRKFFKSMILHPDRFLSIARFLNKTGLVDHGLIRFAEYQMNSQERRNKVYYSWIVFRKLKFNIGHLANLMNNYPIKFTLIVGKYDKVISPKNMNRLLNKLKVYRFEILESGHTGLISQSLPYFIEDQNLK